MLSLPLSFLLCFFKLPHSITMSPCLLFVSQMSLPVQFQLFFLAFLPFCPTHQVTHLASQNPCHLLSKRFLIACFFQFPPSYLWLYFFCFFLFHHKSHFAYHYTVLLCGTHIQFYLTIAHFLQVPPSAHHIIYLESFLNMLVKKFHPSQHAKNKLIIWGNMKLIKFAIFSQIRSFSWSLMKLIFQGPNM